jgi:acetate kinase
LRNPKEGHVLCINSGSSSLKFAVFARGPDDERRVADGAIENIGLEGGRAVLNGAGRRDERAAVCGDHQAALGIAFAFLGEARLENPSIVGHRVVHGGPEHSAPARVDATLVATMRSLVPLAPLHMPAAIAGIEAVTARFPELPQIACFDTAFHASMPEVAHRLPLADRFYTEGIRRYGFHGLSYEYVMASLGAEAPPRIVIAHLGHGASLVAVRDGRAVDTTMGLTPTGGILMGTRTGDLDPGILVYLARDRGLSIDAIERLVTREGGLAAVGGTSDMKTLLERRAVDPRAALAVAMFAYGVRKAIGSYVAILGGLDLLVFTGGIGEHASDVRAEVCAGLDAFGIALDPEANAHGHGLISRQPSRCQVRVVATDEDLVIARHARTWL